MIHLPCCSNNLFLNKSAVQDPDCDVALPERQGVHFPQGVCRFSKQGHCLSDRHPELVPISTVSPSMTKNNDVIANLNFDDNFNDTIEDK